MSGKAITQLPLRIVLIAPPKDVAYGIQRGSGAGYDVDFLQKPKGGDVTFEFGINVKEGKKGEPNFTGEYVQGPTGRRFIYVDVGRYAGQMDTDWARRMIVRLDDIDWSLINRTLKAGKCLEARVPGTSSDGGPNCATVNLVGGWRLTAP